MTSTEYDKGWLVRKIFHLLFTLAIVYYLLPETLFSIPKTVVFLSVIFILPVFIEIIRLKKQKSFLGLHDHEKDHVASYVWFALGATILVIFFPQQIAAPCIVATALGDPVIGLTKPYRRRFMFSIAFFICLAVFLLFNYIFFLALLASGITFIAESFEFKIRIRLRPNIFWSRSRRRYSKYSKIFDFLFRTDDDFMMQIIPALSLFIIFLIFPHLMPEPIINVIPELMPFA